MVPDMPTGYVQTADPDAVAQVVLGKSNWAVIALTLDIELFMQAHYSASIETEPNLSELWKDVFLFHWKEEAHHATLDELELVREDAKLNKAARIHAAPAPLTYAVPDRPEVPLPLAA